MPPSHTRDTRSSRSKPRRWLRRRQRRARRVLRPAGVELPLRVDVPVDAQRVLVADLGRRRPGRQLGRAVDAAQDATAVAPDSLVGVPERRLPGPLPRPPPPPPTGGGGPPRGVAPPPPPTRLGGFPPAR